MNLQSSKGLANDVLDKSQLVEKSITELAAILEETSASLEEMNSSVDTVTSNNEKIATSMNTTTENAKGLLSDSTADR